MVNLIENHLFSLVLTQRTESNQITHNPARSKNNSHQNARVIGEARKNWQQLKGKQFDLLDLPDKTAPLQNAQRLDNLSPARRAMSRVKGYPRIHKSTKRKWKE